MGDEGPYHWLTGKKLTTDQQLRKIRQLPMDREKQGKSPWWLAINQILKLFTCVIIGAGFLKIGELLGLEKGLLIAFAVLASYANVILSKFVFQWP